MKKLFLMLLTFTSCNLAFAQSDFSVTFDSEFEDARNKDLVGQTITMQGIDLGKYQISSTTYHFGVVDVDGSRKICKVMSFDGLEKALQMDIYTVNPEFGANDYKIENAKNSFDETYYKVLVLIPMTTKSYSLILSTIEDLRIDESTFEFNTEEEANAFVAFMLGN